MANVKKAAMQSPSIRVDVVEPESQVQRGWLGCKIGANVRFSTDDLETYCFKEWRPIVYDALLVAAAVEFGDRTQRRPSMKWEREIELRIPVHDPGHWNDHRVADALHDALDFLTGDRWHITFYQRGHPPSSPRQGMLSLPEGLSAVIPFSDGLDSRIVAGLMERELGAKLIRVRLGSKASGRASRQRYPFTSVPYHVRPGAKEFAESSARSRGFKFARISGLAAYLANAGRINVS